MSSVYLIRHGQAGTRWNYDALSELGREQARQLGRYLAGQGIRFKAIYSGALKRQQETACEVCRACAAAGLAPPPVTVDPGWNEFDLDQVYEGVGPLLRRDDPEFRREYEEMLRVMTDQEAPVHRQWSSCDSSVVRAWIEDRYTFGGESWADFHRRISGCMDSLYQYGSGESVAVFTSATPVAIWVGLALELDAAKVVRLAGIVYNSAITTLRIHERQLTLFSFNGVPHLSDASQRTFR